MLSRSLCSSIIVFPPKCSEGCVGMGYPALQCALYRRGLLFSISATLYLLVYDPLDTRTLCPLDDLCLHFFYYDCHVCTLELVCMEPSIHIFDILAPIYFPSDQLIRLPFEIARDASTNRLKPDLSLARHPAGFFFIWRGLRVGTLAHS